MKVREKYILFLDIRGLTNIDKATIIDPLNNPRSEEYAELLAELRKKKDGVERLLRHAVKGMLPKGPLGRKMIKKLFVYAGSEHEQQAQQPKVMEVK